MSTNVDVAMWRAWIDLVRQVQACPDGDLKHAAPRTSAQPLPAAAELDLFEEADLLVITGREFVPDTADALASMNRLGHGNLV
jgi:hypothetical protein